MRLRKRDPLYPMGMWRLHGRRSSFRLPTISSELICGLPCCSSVLLPWSWYCFLSPIVSCVLYWLLLLYEIRGNDGAFHYFTRRKNAGKRYFSQYRPIHAMLLVLQSRLPSCQFLVIHDGVEVIVTAQPDFAIPFLVDAWYDGGVSIGSKPYSTCCFTKRPWSSSRAFFDILPQIVTGCNQIALFSWCTVRCRVFSQGKKVIFLVSTWENALYPLHYTE